MDRKVTDLIQVTYMDIWYRFNFWKKHISQQTNGEKV